jgi:L-threonylcarbamoyladenylate synthase
MSGHPVFDRIVKSLGKPLAAPSANRFGRISPTTGQHVLQELGGRISMILDGGPAQKGVESTVARVTGGRIEILRKGPVTTEELAEIAEVKDVIHVRGAIFSPGQTESHYAPSTPLLLVGNASEFKGSAAKVGLLAWNISDPGRFVEVRHLSQTQDLIEAAARLFSLLRELDAAHLDFIVAESVPETGIGAAIMDRLRRASART